ncbi:hypothetical protein [Ornithinimicrobium tianjinense]|uniref:Uncharacterized protein n=1 Tax=Ornithinimicrobium tianjinense TaxID=1195761 RepID=A0A917F7I7_9MICO|nr:hypothetical protein [Ornithinimicrobium tianjinense]GGF57946.1 hypothetical protein GCM10011366_27150 [Ornithinimicrobium tianjinense]
MSPGASPGADVWDTLLAAGSATTTFLDRRTWDRRSTEEPGSLPRGSYDLAQGRLELAWATGRQLVATWRGAPVASGQAQFHEALPWPWTTMPLTLGGVEVTCGRVAVEPTPRSPLVAHTQLVAAREDGGGSWVYRVVGPTVPRPVKERSVGTHRALLERADGTVVVTHDLPPLLEQVMAEGSRTTGVSWVEGTRLAELVLALMWTADELFRGVAPPAYRTANLDFW